MGFPMTQIEDLQISRLMIGTNWFLGYSHYSKAKDQWIKAYMNQRRIAEIMTVFAHNGINAVMSPPNALMRSALDRVEKETGVEMHWVVTPSGETTEELLTGVEQCAELGARVCMPHQHWTDGNLVVNEKRVVGLEQVTERIRALGMIPGLSTHRPETVVVCDQAGYDVATYIQIYNAIGFLCQVETDWAARVINETKKPVMIIKPLAAGRVLPPTGLSFVYNSIKPIDTVCIGTLSTYEAEDDIALAREILNKRQVSQRDLTYSRSKGSLVR